MIRFRSISLALPLLLGACVSFAPVPREGALAVQQEVWWTRLQGLCGKSFAGRLLEGSRDDEQYLRNRLVLRVAECDAEEVDMGFDVGADRSRIWVVSRTESGLQLTHLHSDGGREAEISRYGGQTLTAGAAQRQDFYADEHTKRMLPAAADNVWTMEIAPGRAFAYTLARRGTDRRFRVEFDLRRPVAAR
jgi:hypothetical protein